jgi:hypothetical protein
MSYFYGASHEQFGPEALLRHAVAAERAIEVLGRDVLPALRKARV